MVWSELALGFIDLFLAPFRDVSVLWLVAPAFIIWLLLEFYFVRYKKEELGWNTSLANGFSLFWIGIALCKFLFGLESFAWVKLVIPILLIAYGLIIILIVFKHSVPKQLAFLMASPTLIYFVTIYGILWVYDLVALTIWTILALTILIGIVSVVIFLTRKFLPSKEGDLGKGDLGGDLSGEMPELGKDFDLKGSSSPNLGKEPKLPKI